MSEFGEPNTPREMAQERIERTVRDAWLCITEISKAHADPIAEQFVLDCENDLWSMKNKLDFLLSAIEAGKQRAA